MIRTLVPWPHPLLAAKCLPIELWNEHLKTLVQDLEDTARTYGGDMMSMAAPQIGSPTRVIYIGKALAAGQAMTLINPEMLSHGTELQVVAEQCLSLPGIEIKVQRYKDVVIGARRPNGDSATIKCDGMLAQAIQHELNHLNGKTIAECCNPIKRRFLAEQQLQKQHAGLSL